jgi:hypothetical protein
MEQRQEIMDEVTDDALDVGLEEEGDEVVEQVLEEIGVDLSQAVGLTSVLSIPHAGPFAYHVCHYSLARRLRDCSRMRLRRRRSLRQLVEVAEAAPTRATTISRHDSTA